MTTNRHRIKRPRSTSINPECVGLWRRITQLWPKRLACQLKSCDFPPNEYCADCTELGEVETRLQHLLGLHTWQTDLVFADDDEPPPHAVPAEYAQVRALRVALDKAIGINEDADEAEELPAQ